MARLIERLNLSTRPSAATSVNSTDSITIYQGNEIYTTTLAEIIASVIEPGWGPKSSAIDAGTLKQVSLTDDYAYVCVQAGTAGNAIWKRYALHISP